MITDNYSKMMSDAGMRSMLPTSEELGLMMMGTCSTDRERELNMYRSGSAPPTVEGSLNAFGGLFGGGLTAEFGGKSDEELRSDPAYIPYYYTNVNLNPRLPPPLLSMEDQRLAQRLQGGGAGGSRNSAIGDRRNVNRDDGSSGRSMFASQLGFTGNNDENNGLPELRNPQGGGTEWGGHGLIGFPGLGIGGRQKSISEIIQDDISQSASSSRHPFHPASRNNIFSDNVEPSESQFTHLHQELASIDALRSRANLQGMPSPTLGGSLARTTTPDSQLMARLAGPRVPAIGGSRVSSLNGHEPSDLVSALSSLSLSTPSLNNLGLGGSPSHYQNLENQNSSFSSYGLGGYGGSPSMAAASHSGSGSPPPALLDKYAVAAAMGVSGIDPRAIGGGFSTESSNDSYMELLAFQKAYLAAQKSNYGLRSGTSNHGSYGNLGYGLGMSYDMSPRFPLGTRNLAGGVMGSMDESFASTLLEEFKNNKTRCFELSEITGHVVDFSADQYGSRFIQQKLETATTEDKNMVFHEIMPQALTLMTDVFGNYVIQKFFEHGTAPQIREMADQLIGHVLTLSLQMYGCRVIQKAIEVVDLDQQTKMVAELDGHVMRCVRDQNGNHVIQKCIECIPEDAIEFIISTFYDQVVTLSTHPYGCRVIQRVLEHCVNPKTQAIVMDEILKSVSMLAQDQYGNYVVQHVLQHGKPHERASIINQLSGNIVSMSLQKFASNVVEKCLTFGTLEERQNLVTEMLGTTDENEPLQAMMKDQFGNYVVQKVLETCDDQQLEMILNRIKVHLNALKKYTYGKHIVARVEKLVAAGERRIGILAGYSGA